MSTTEYRETVEIYSEISVDTNRIINDNETETRSNNSSLPQSFLNDFHELNIEDQRYTRYDDEVPSEIVTRNRTITNTSTPTGTIINHVTATAPSDTVTNNTHLSIGTSTIVPSATTDDARLRKREVIRRREKAILKTLANIERSMKVDLCYVLDCTGSMAGHIAAAKDCILQVTEYIKNTNPSIKINVGFCGYRDHCDNSLRLQNFDFTNSYEEFRRNIASVPATGGGDGPEDVLGGLHAAITQMSWNDGTRVLFHIGDYPPHGKRFTTMQDEYPDGDPNGLTAENVLQKMQSENIFYFFGKITNFTDTMIEVFRSIIGEFSIFELVGGDPIELINKFVAATTSSITMSVSLTSTIGTRRNLNSSTRRLEIDRNMPDWDTRPARKGVTLCYYIPENVEEIKNERFYDKRNLISKTFHFKIAEKPFAAGVEKYAYYAINTKYDPPRRIVMKEYLTDGTANPFEKYLESTEISALTSYLTIKFNSKARGKDIPFVNFLRVNLVRSTFDGRTRYYISEPELQDAEFKRFNVNSGVIVEFRPALEAFVHFTYEHTGGYLIVSDLQGIELPNQFLLTDPAIHCIDPVRFGKTNLGRNGINRCFLDSHRCNDVCRTLRLPSRE
ncbi:16291_t:CDS:2 [Cetraspora pellucida]|uniref:16291_t:CDS:1 n=1 Tax=Cetraspora pellucida TaxID=1433469 RepID=A0ACA9K231_9GLOM|nr:16291_t:CDS:2 [Cetraspora pellucida]